MSEDKLVKLYTGAKVIVSRIVAELETQGIHSILKDGFRQGIEAGYGGGVPSAIDIYVVEEDLKNATEIVKALTEETCL